MLETPVRTAKYFYYCSRIWLVPLAAGLAILITGCSARGAGGGAPLAIAAVGPMTGSAAARGKDLEQAARMAVDEANAAGGVNGHRIELTVYDDGDQPSKARQLAQQVATTPALAVLGQVASSAGAAAGEVYKQQGIPAITGAASEARVTKDNPWFFRLFRDAGGQGEFLADYARYRFGARQIAILREQGTAGDEFASALRDRAKSEGIKIVADVELTPAQAKDPAAVAEAARKLSKLPKGGILALGTQYAETPPVLRVLRDKLGPFTSLGYSSLATEGLNGLFEEAENGHRAPGFYTDGLTVAAPQLGDVAEYAQTVFASRYKARYGSDPTPEAVRWYEGAQLIFQAIAAKNVSGTDRSGDRRRIRDWMAALDRPETAAAGIAGPIFFDKDHNAQRGIAVGIFTDGHLVSAPVQFIPVSDPDQVPGWDALKSSGMVIDASGVKYVKTPVVYAGIDLNTLDNIDVRANTFAADFFLWLRYQDDLNLDPHEVEFPTVVSGATLGKEVGHRSHLGFTTVTYHVKGVFRSDYEFSRFPFDEQTLRIPIQFHNSNSYTMILAYGQTGAKQQAADGKKPVASKADSVLASKLWRIKNQIFYRDVVAYKSSFGEEPGAKGQSDVEVNRINAAITIQRDVAGFAVKNFLPLVCILVAVLIGYALAPDVINPRVSIGVTALLTTSVLYQKLAGDLPTVTYITAMDYVFFAFFAFCVIFLLLTVVTYETHREKRVRPTKILNRGGFVLTLLTLALTLTFVWVRYWGQA
jgi:ABC-type branched-subunit amino acid transport system substrate-binding protein